MIYLRTFNILPNMNVLYNLPEKKLLITTINAHSFNVAQKDELFAQALLESDVLLPDGASIVWASKVLNNIKIERVAGADLFDFEMQKLSKKGGKCFFLGSSITVLKLIEERASIEYPNIEIITYSPPYTDEFTEEENITMIEAVNEANPDLLWVGMTAPKQEKWIYQHLDEFNISCHIGCIGAVFDFYAGTIKRAPTWMMNIGLEWLYRLIKEPLRLWRRYIIGNILFINRIFKEKNKK